MLVVANVHAYAHEAATDAQIAQILVRDPCVLHYARYARTYTHIVRVYMCMCVNRYVCVPESTLSQTVPAFVLGAIICLNTYHVNREHWRAGTWGW